MGKRKKQKVFEFPVAKTWGGRRAGAGRKPKNKKAGVSHQKREAFVGDCPLHVTVKLVGGLASLRRLGEQRVVKGVMRKYGEREGFRVVHCSIQGDHVHMVVEACGPRELESGMRAFCTRLAKTLNAAWGRSGRVLAERFHSRLLRTPTEVRNVLRYVFHNARNHGLWGWEDVPDPCSSGDLFDGWEDYRPPAGVIRWLPAPVTRLVRSGWRRAGPIRLAYD
jgi:REP element-mobilizing transposase RayT